MTDEQGTPQFGTAEYSTKSGGDRCQTCEQPITGTYYRVSGAATCAACAEKAAGQLPKDTTKAYGRGLLFGIGGAVLGLILYSTVGIVTGLAIGYVSLAVGFIVGKAMMMGSWGIGGRRYQVTAAALTYAAVSMSAVPVSIAIMIREGNPAGPRQGTTTPGQAQAPSSSGTTGAAKDPAVEVTIEEPKQQMSIGAAVGFLILVGLASPFLELASPLSGIIGLVILAVGIQIAWKMTEGQKLEILGPFNT